MGHFFKAFISSTSQIIKEKIYCQNIGANTPYQQQVQVFYQITCYGTGTLQISQNLDHCPISHKLIIYF